MKKTANTYHGYDQEKLRSQGTSANHVVYGKVSMFDCLLRTVIHIALDPDSQSQVREDSMKETADDVFKAATSILLKVLELQNDGLNMVQTMSIEANLVPLHQFTLNCMSKEDLVQLDQKVLYFLDESIIDDRKQLMVQLVWHVCSIESINRGLDLARDFRLYKTLTQIAYQGGKLEHYDRIYEILGNEQGEYRVEWAMRTVYD